MQASSTSAEQFVDRQLGPYTLTALIGQGQWNAVYQARHTSSPQTALLTLFFLPPTFSPLARQRFITRLHQEGTALKKLQHPYILPVLAVGEQAGLPYLVTPMVPGNTLARLLKHKGSLSPEQTLEVLQPLASALDYAHSQGVLHGALSTSNVLLDADKTMRLLRFRWHRLSMLQGITEAPQSDSHLLTIASTPLTGLAYLAPEVIQGAQPDESSDIYSLGILLFELLTGTLPFPHIHTLALAHQYARSPIPSLSSRQSALPVSLDLVIQVATKLDPSQRFQSADQFVRAFEQALSSPGTATLSIPADQPATPTTPPIQPAQPAISPSTTRSLLHPPIITGHLPTTPRPVTQSHPAPPLSSTSARLPATARPLDLPQSPMPTPKAPATPDQSWRAHSMDPFAWWESTSKQAALSNPSNPATSKHATPTPYQQAQPASATRTTQQRERRRVMTLLATGGVLAVGALGFGGVGLARLMQGSQDPSSIAQRPQTSQSTTSTTVSSPTKTTVQKTPTKSTTQPTPQSTQPANNPNPTPTPQKQGPASTPTPQQSPPTPTPKLQPTQPPSSGTVIGNNSLAIDASKDFTNPANGNPAVLIHLPNGNFVAYETPCTHEGTEVFYDPSQHRLICSSHGAMFDPSQGAKVVKGPARAPLASVSIKINSNGTITTG